MNLVQYTKNGIRDIFIRPAHNIPALDGLRATAIILVFAMHLNEFFTNTLHSTSILNSLPPFRGGWIGVPLFFVLSGYLIGGQLWKELIKTNSINVSKFIIRRGFRIWPLYYFAVLTIFILSIFNILSPISTDGLISNLLFLSNFWKDSGPIPGSAWSLATEEHFYILAPFFMLLSAKLFKNKPLSFYRTLLYISFFLPLLNRFIVWNFIYQMVHFDLSTYMKVIYRPIFTNSEGLIAGMIISNLVMDKSFKIPKILTFRSLLLAVSIPFVILSFKDKIYLNFTMIAISFSLLLWVCLDSKALLTRFFAHPIFFPISKTSFAIYLIHKHVIDTLLSTNWFSQLNLSNSISLIFAFGLTLLSSFLLGSICYIIIEKPFLELRNKYM